MCAIFLCLKVDRARVAEFIQKQKQKQKQCNKYSCKCAFKCNYTHINTDTTHTHTHSAYFCYVFVSLTLSFLVSLSLSAALSLARSRPKSHNFPIKRKWAIYLPWNQWESPIKISSFCRTRRSACCCCCCRVVVVVLLWLLLFFALVAESATRNVCRRCNYLLCAWQWRQAGEWGATASECLHEEVCLGQAERAGGSYSSCCHCCGWITVAVCVCGGVCVRHLTPRAKRPHSLCQHESSDALPLPLSLPQSLQQQFGIPCHSARSLVHATVRCLCRLMLLLVLLLLLLLLLHCSPPRIVVLSACFFCNFSAEHSLCFFFCSNLKWKIAECTCGCCYCCYYWDTL